MQARSFKVVVATWQIIGLAVTPPLHAPTIDVGSEALNYWLRCERVARGYPRNFLLRNPDLTHDRPLVVKTISRCMQEPSQSEGDHLLRCNNDFDTAHLYAFTFSGSPSPGRYQISNCGIRVR